MKKVTSIFSFIFLFSFIFIFSCNENKQVIVENKNYESFNSTNSSNSKQIDTYTRKAIKKNQIDSTKITSTNYNQTENNLKDEVNKLVEGKSSNNLTSNKDIAPTEKDFSKTKIGSRIEKMFAKEIDLNFDKAMDYLLFYKLISPKDTNYYFSLYLNKNSSLDGVYDYHFNDKVEKIRDVLVYSDSVFVVRYINKRNKSLSQKSFKINEINEVIPNQ